MPYDLQPDSLDRELVLSFFWRFSVFECALKREGFVRGSRNDGAQPDWTKFGDQVRGRFGEVSKREFQVAIRTLMESPPRRQVVRGKQLAWETIERGEQEPVEVFVLRLVRAARNNLFHGGKYPDGPIEEVARDKAILQAALDVLEGCYELHPGVARWAEEAA